MHTYTITSRFGAPKTFESDYTGPGKIGRMSMELFIHEERKDELVRSGVSRRNSELLKAWGKSTVYKWSRVICPTLITPQPENDRRVQQLCDMFSAVSHAVISDAILNPEGYVDGRECRILVGNMYTFDAVSGLISGGASSKVRCMKITKEHLRKLGLGVFTNEVKAAVFFLFT